MPEITPLIPTNIRDAALLRGKSVTVFVHCSGRRCRPSALARNNAAGSSDGEKAQDARDARFAIDIAAIISVEVEGDERGACLCHLSGEKLVEQSLPCAGMDRCRLSNNASSRPLPSAMEYLATRAFSVEPKVARIFFGAARPTVASRRALRYLVSWVH